MQACTHAHAYHMKTNAGVFSNVHVQMNATFIQHAPFITYTIHTHTLTAHKPHTPNNMSPINFRFNSPCFLPRAALAVTSSSGIKGTETALQVLHKTQQSVVFISGTSPPSLSA